MRLHPGQTRVCDLVIVLVLVFFGLAGGIPGIAPNQASEMTGVPASHLQALVGVGTQLVVDLAILAMLVQSARQLRPRAAQLVWPLALAVWTIASVAWSVDPKLTVRRCLPFVLAAAFGALLALRLPVRQMLRHLQLAFTVLACWSALLAVAFPSIGLDASTGHGGDWQGVFTQKNACGRAMVIAIASVLASAGAPNQKGRTFTASQLSLLVLFGGELLLSGSRGAWLVCAAVAAAMLLLWVSASMERRTRAYFLSGAGVSSILMAWGGSAAFTVLAPMMGRDASLTGRTAIWHEVWRAIALHPWVGYGFSAFWQGLTGASWSVVLALHFVLFHAHNGFLEIWLELGAAGLAIFAFTFLRACFLLWPELRCGHFSEAAWPAALLLLAVLYDLDENTLLSFNGLFWVLYTGALTRIELLASERRKVAALLRVPRLQTSGPWIVATPHAARPATISAPGHQLHSQPAIRVSPWL